MSRINAKLGLKPQTRARARVVGAGKDRAAALVTSAICPRCGHRWMLTRLVVGARGFWCGWCSYGLGGGEQVTG